METVLRAVFVYLLALFIVRVVGRRVGKRLTPFEILLIFLVGGQLTQAILADDRSLTNATIGVVTVGSMHALVAFLKERWKTAAKLVDGTPVLVYAEGSWFDDRMDMVRINREDVLSQARQDGLEGPEKIRYAIVERNGAISIIPAEQD